MSTLWGGWAEMRGWGKWEEKVQGQVAATARTERHLRSVMETWCSRICLKQTKAVLRKSSNNEGGRITNNHLLLRYKASSTRSGLHSTQLLCKGIPQKSPQNPWCSQVNRLFSKTRLTTRVCCWTTTTIQLTEHREVVPVTITSLHPYVLVSSVQKDTPQATKREMQHPHSHEVVHLRFCPASKACQDKGATKFVESPV